MAPDGYQVILRRGRGDTLAPAAFPELEFAVEDIRG